MHNKIHKRDSLRIDPPETSSRRADWRCLIALTCLLAPAPGALAAIPAEWKNTAYAYEAQHKPLREVWKILPRHLAPNSRSRACWRATSTARYAPIPRSRCSTGTGVEHRFSGISTTTPCTSAPSISKSPHAWRCRRNHCRPQAGADRYRPARQSFRLGRIAGGRCRPGLRPPALYRTDQAVQQPAPFTGRKQSVLSYPLKFANAADRQMEYRNERITIPGVATMLRGLLDPHAIPRCSPA